ncbi:hypothetical protein CAOG_05676 [Capsaspora owczarzaki ATCC 30864]|uniref:Arpin n=1 Tax=Capsaspora owczarzaki (strain ATCC 30864) TaxID=595528 RepID=A0A0D2WTX4_CAPO3|nr:hypothetical protein CAOG_05676 [Capsaspora owczarzaki ATCC 30864]KJE95198.1 hypothetical protein CAOG_005676 [Capsaspora owczarzaki ATCC 30864]|eukprot:XP_004346349.1 hypothetical protein CAOG_05676 [Capsaspora owczarzaki ATCC 30864]
MSREHMLYDDRALQSTPSTASNYAGSLSIGGSGVGVLFEGRFAERTRHTITDASGAKHRFIILHCDYVSAFRRQYDEKGKEIEANQGKTTKVNTGYLNSSYKLKDSDADAVSVDQLHRMVAPTVSKLARPGHATSGKTLEFWGEEDVLKKFEFYKGDGVRLKTRGESPFIETIARLDTATSQIANYSGDQPVGQSWTDKLMTKGKQTEANLSTKDKAGASADDSEWD